MWADFSGKPYTREQFAKRVADMRWTDWKPVGITLHNTAAPTLAQWAESGVAHAARIRNLQSYYEGMGWHGGPHWFISREWLNEFSNPLRRGTHSPSFNATHFGIEMVGDFSREAFNSGAGAKVRDNAVFAMAVLCRKFGWDPAKVIVLHKDDPKTTHDCPGKFVVKADVIARVQAEMLRLAGQPAVKPVPVTPPGLPAVTPPIATSQRQRMAKAIVDFEARRDASGRLAVYILPSNDGGGTYEVAGINDRYHPEQAAKLKRLIQAGAHDEAENSVIEYLLAYTQIAATWTKDAGVEFYLRDCVFNRGPKGAARILQRAVRVKDDGVVGPMTRGAIARYADEAAGDIRDVHDLLTRLRTAREEYEREVVGYRANFWVGLVSRWDKALAAARKFQSEAPAGTGKTAATATAGAVVAAGAAAATAAHQSSVSVGAIVLIVAATAAAALGVWLLVRYLKGRQP